MQAGKRSLSALQDFQLHTLLGVFREVRRLTPTRPEAATAIAPAGYFNETRTVKAALECKKAVARYQAQRLLTHPR